MSRCDPCASSDIDLRLEPVLYWRATGGGGTMTGFDCISALKALGEESRLRILRLLFKDALSVTEIAGRLRLSQYNVSKHLRVMREAGLLESEKQGKLRLYAVSGRLKKQVAANNNVLDLGCCTFRLDKLPK